MELVLGAEWDPLEEQKVLLSPKLYLWTLSPFPMTLESHLGFRSFKTIWSWADELAQWYFMSQPFVYLWGNFAVKSLLTSSCGLLKMILTCQSIFLLTYPWKNSEYLESYSSTSSLSNWLFFCCCRHPIKQTQLTWILVVYPFFWSLYAPAIFDPMESVHEPQLTGECPLWGGDTHVHMDLSVKWIQSGSRGVGMGVVLAF